ncbi:MAG: nicotinate-nucleotide--dimethylbenzimidazole phosphoribosyltransferase [Alphaproteobacteria bacterium]|jgi:nicotinate-nucleotide--dimethylbenzimidazole phosphoribosyltransferase
MSELPTVTSLDDVRRLMAALPGPDQAAADEAAEHEAQLTKPAGSLGRLEALSAWTAAWQGGYPPRADNLLTCVFAGNHGVVAQGVSAFPPSVTEQMVANFQAGGAAINQICAVVGARLKVIPLALDEPTVDFTTGPAMDEAACVGAIAAGMAALEDDVDILCLGEMGIANTTSAAALACSLFGGEPASWIGAGTGIDEAGMERKRVAVEQAMALHGEALADPWEALRRVGGRELAGIAGAVLAARLKRTPVLLDGYVCSAAAAVLAADNESGLDHCQLAHLSVEPGHRRLADHLNKTPLLDLAMRLGEGTGAALAAGLLRAAVQTHNGMATFADAGVSGKSE